MNSAQRSYDEMVDFFARGSTTAQVINFRPSPESQERVRYLLERNKAGNLTEDEAEELERFGEIEHLMQLVKARAWLYSQEQS